MKTTVAVLAGGSSSEHEVSLASATEVVRALVTRDYPTKLVWIAPDGSWHRVSSRRLALAAGATEFNPERILELGQAAPPEHAFHALRELDARGVGVVFPALHGRDGEDGTIQACLEHAGIPYVGSAVTASAVGMSKRLTRLVFTGAGLDMPRAFVPDPQFARRANARAVERALENAEIGYPCFVKADNCGSSLGVSRVTRRWELATALQNVRNHDTDWVIEEGLTGLELTCGVLGNSGGPLRALPPVQITPIRASFFDYETKYDAEAVEELCPAPLLDDEDRQHVEEVSIQAHELLGCRGFSRTDMILSAGRLYLLETNTIPGLTPESLLPKAARASGISFEDLIEQMVAYALDDAPRLHPAAHDRVSPQRPAAVEAGSA